MTTATAWRFDPLDTWFFREARGFDTSGSHELSSLFPPPARTLAGAIRTLIGEQQGVDWEQFAQDGEYADLKGWIGAGDDLGALRLTGPYPLWQGERLYPAPLDLLAKGKAYRRLTPGAPVACDLGMVRLPALDTPLPGAKPLEQAWLTGSDLRQVLNGQAPSQVFRAGDLYAEESRLGIARDNRRRTTGIDGLLYQTRHLRAHDGLAIGAEVRGLPSALQPARGLTRFGGEGRTAAVTITPAPAPLTAPAPEGQRLLLLLLTPADFGKDWFPPGFRPQQHDGLTVWCGDLHGISLILHSAVIGKAAREGGWDLLRQQSRPVKSLVPAGSVFFCSIEGDPRHAVQALHGQHIGHDTALGRGELAVGLWRMKEKNET